MSSSASVRVVRRETPLADGRALVIGRLERWGFICVVPREERRPLCARNVKRQLQRTVVDVPSPWGFKQLLMGRVLGALSEEKDRVASSCQSKDDAKKKREGDLWVCLVAASQSLVDGFWRDLAVACKNVVRPLNIPLSDVRHLFPARDEHSIAVNAAKFIQKRHFPTIIYCGRADAKFKAQHQITEVLQLLWPTKSLFWRKICNSCYNYEHIHHRLRPLVAVPECEKTIQCAIEGCLNRAKIHEEIGKEVRKKSALTTRLCAFARHQRALRARPSRS
ncbi:hypothetical protein B0H13DRAFT_1862168 [Mycena leptocephala]|nr:hypothetical protein B0H13DRAFT_1862168 [Mycena leptocephala]